MACMQIQYYILSPTKIPPNTTGNGHPMAVVRCLCLLLLLLSHNSLSQNSSSSSSINALLKFKNSLSNSDSLTNWKESSSSPCDRDNIWIGIVCTRDMVSSINLASMGLQGRPNLAAFAPLQDLQAISLQNNSLLGPIPAFNSVPSLKAIYASKNQFSGVIPHTYFQAFASLKTLWLSDNKFSGPIPKSLAELLYLKELHLENNHFSGPIPGPLNRFDKQDFDNNPDLCGLKASKECPLPDSKSILAKKLIISAIAVTLLLLLISIKDKKKQEKVRIICKEQMNDEAVAVTIPNISARKSSSARKGLNKSRSKNSGSQPVGEVVMLNEDKGVFDSQDLMKASAEVLGSGGMGSAYKATLGNGMLVVLKRMKEMNKMSKDVFETEMRKLGRLKHQNILTPLAYHFRKEDKFLVSQYVPKGSLHNVLHGDRGLTWPNRLKTIKGVARAMGYLHSELASYDLPHGNLKSCNVLIGQDYEPLVTDYALHPLINDTPTAESLFAYRSPEAMLYQHVSQKTDVYCLGIIILEVVTGRYPSQYIVNSQKGESGTDVVQWVRSALDENREGELIDPEVLELGAKECMGQIEELLRIGADCTESEDDIRIDMTEAITRIEDV